MTVRIDKSKGKQVLQEDFNQYIMSCIHKKSPSRKISVHHSYSHSWSGLQFADVVAWSIFQSFERNNDEYIQCIKEITDIQILYE